MNSSYRPSRIGFCLTGTTRLWLDVFACIPFYTAYYVLYNCNMVVWSWWDWSLIWTLVNKARDVNARAKKTPERERDLFSDISMLSERHVAHRTDRGSNTCWDEIHYLKKIIGGHKLKTKSVRLSLFPFVTRVLCDEMKEYRPTADILIPHVTAVTLVLWHQQQLAGDVPFHVKFALRLTHPFETRPLRLISAHTVSTVRATERNSGITNRKTTTRFPTSYTWSAYVTPNSPKGWLKKQICSFCE